LTYKLFLFKGIIADLKQISQKGLHGGRLGVGGNDASPDQ
jgi:hypothetical protein